MQAISVMQRLAATDSRGGKEQIIFDAFMGECWEFFTAARLALDPLHTFGVKKVAEIIDDDGDHGDYDFAEFVALAQQLQARRLTGHAARDAIRTAALRCDATTWNQFYRRVLLKDLGVGVDASTFNKVLHKLMPTHRQAVQYLIPVFKCQLAHDGAAHAKKLCGRKLLDVKLDGVRTLTMLDTDVGVVSLFTRNGQPIAGFPEMHKTLQAVLEKLPGPVMLDGELTSPNGFQHLMTMMKRKDVHADADMVRYALFDIVPLADFRAGYCGQSQQARRLVLEALHHSGYFVPPETLGNRLYVVSQIEVDLDTVEGQAAFAAFNRQAITDGYEGIMLKDPAAPYEGKRSTAWLKKKPKIRVTLPVIGVEPGEADGKYAATLGALVCRGVDDGVEIETNVSGGLTDKLRDELWLRRDQLPGMLVDVEGDKLTLREGAAVYSIRFPEFVGFRGHTPGEKL